MARSGAPLLCDLADRVARLACAQETETQLVNVWQTLESPGFLSSVHAFNIAEARDARLLTCYTAGLGPDDAKGHILNNTYKSEKCRQGLPTVHCVLLDRRRRDAEQHFTAEVLSNID